MYFLWDSSNFFLKNRVDSVTRLSHGGQMKFYYTSQFYRQFSDTSGEFIFIRKLPSRVCYSSFKNVLHYFTFAIAINCLAPNLILTPWQKHHLFLECNSHVESISTIRHNAFTTKHPEHGLLGPRVERARFCVATN